MHRAGLLPFAFLVLALGCRAPDEAAAPAPPPEAILVDTLLTLQAVANPAAPGSAEPNLYAGTEGRVLLSWVEPGAGGHTLRFARWTGSGWSAPQTVAEGADWFINWADFPSVIVLDEGALAAHYLAKSANSPYAYDVRLTRSEDGGATWTPAVTPHRDGTPTEHGFVSLLPAPDGRLRAVWLDGRNTGGGHDPHGGGPMTLRTATLDAAGTLHDEAELDARICDCCQTAAARTADGLVVAYRDRSDADVRDIALVRLAGGRWTPSQPVHTDGWTIHGCPVNGPAVAADGRRVAVAWFTAANDVPHVRLSLSTDAGTTFGEALDVDDGHPLGRVDVAWLPDASVMVSWIEQTDAGADLRLRRVYPGGSVLPTQTVAATSAARASGFPHLAATGSAVFVAWTEAGTPSAVRTAVAALR